MKRNLIAVIALLTANAAFAMPMLPGDLEGDWRQVKGGAESTSYVPSEKSQQPVYEFIL